MWKKFLGAAALLYAADQIEFDTKDSKPKAKEETVLKTAEDISKLLLETLENGRAHVKSGKNGIAYFSSMHQCRLSSEASGFIIQPDPDGYEVKFIRDCVEGPGYKVYSTEYFFADTDNAKDRSDFELIDETYQKLMD